MRRFLLALLLLPLTTAARGEFDVVEAGIADMQQVMASGRLTSRELVQQYLSRIARYDRKLNAVITVNPNALREAEARDRERGEGRVRGPLHGIPIALKDNIHTADMPTTGGALAFDGYVPPYEATLVKSLREAGVVIIAKTGMTELANWMAGPPTPMPSGYNPISGFGMNPYDPRRDPREANFDGRPVLLPGGSSSGIGTAANFWAANVGTETSGSLLNPANATMLVTIKPTVVRISRHGIIPLTADQDTAGPMARSVADAAILFGALEDAQADAQDPMKPCAPPENRDRARYEHDRAKDIALSAAHGIDAIMAGQKLDALLLPAGSGAILSARPGYPTVLVPFAMVANPPNPPFPAGFDAKPAPFGVSFVGGACSEPRLIALAYAFEQATRRRVPPPGMP